MDYCKKCGTQIATTNHYGTNDDFTSNKDFCSDCYKEGSFTSSNGFNDLDFSVSPMMLAYTGAYNGATEGLNNLPSIAPIFMDLDNIPSNE